MPASDTFVQISTRITRPQLAELQRIQREKGVPQAATIRRLLDVGLWQKEIEFPTSGEGGR